MSNTCTSARRRRKGYGWVPYLNAWVPLAKKPRPAPPEPDVKLTLSREGPERWLLRAHGVRSSNLDFEVRITTRELVLYPALRRRVQRAVGVSLAPMRHDDWSRIANELLRPRREWANRPRRWA
jgi:hypothetical protein